MNSSNMKLKGAISSLRLVFHPPYYQCSVSSTVPQHPRFMLFQYNTCIKTNRVIIAHTLPWQFRKQTRSQNDSEINGSRYSTNLIYSLFTCYRNFVSYFAACKQDQLVVFYYSFR